MRMGRLITEVNMPVEAIESEIGDAYLGLATSAGTARYRQQHYLDGQTAGTLFGAVTALTAGHPWALGSFGDRTWDSYQPALDAPLPDGLRIGMLRASGGERLPPLPAVTRLARYGHLLITEGGRPDRARSLLQALTLRLAVATVPGMVRLALADPAGQGHYLSAFLRLPPSLRVGSGVAAGPAEIEVLLTRLTEHVVDVTQTRLTNVHDSVEAYNGTTTGAMVPYHVLVFAGFPADVTDRAAELLSRLARNGPRAGLYILATRDPRLELPRGLDLAALTATATQLNLDDRGNLAWDDPDYGPSVAEPDQMPAAARVNPWLDAVGAAASSAARDLAFRRIAIPASQRWSGTTTDGLDVQIGVDSKGEPQHFVMGVRGIHHGLVGGDVRMGKTNLLHVLISQLALRYPPEELQLYLLDFKEVEFDAYLTERLPHARAITSRTDREFGLSMLRRFHDEIDWRARLCREARVTDLPDYRRETGQVLPRALVIMDEFQVLFSEEDRLASEAGRLLADIAKRGAAFGLHLLFTTQSPGGPLAAYLRPVYEQMALRIALGCTQPSVSQAILGEGNDAATKLIRAGDAIYNDRRGEGANPVMRIAMLPTRERLELIADIRALGGGRDYPPPASFDPDAPADFAPRGCVSVCHGWAKMAGRHRGGVARRGHRDQARDHGDVRPLCPVQPARRGKRGTWSRAAAGYSAQRRGPVLPGGMSLSPSPNSPGRRRRSTVSSPRGEPAAPGMDRRPPERPGGAGRSHRRPGRAAGRLRRGRPPSRAVLPHRRDAPLARTAGRGRLRPAQRDLGASPPPGRQGTGSRHSRGGLDRQLRHRRTGPAAGQASATSACARCSACCPRQKATPCSG